MGTSSLATLIQKIRTDAGDSPAKAAGKVGVSRQGYLKWESGDTANMKLGNLLSFCDQYEIDVGLLLRGIIAISGEAHETTATRQTTDIVKGIDPVIAYSATPIAAQLTAEEPNPDIRKLIEAYSVADEKDREQMLWLADRALSAFDKRSEQNN